jgi:hypothetical protein
VVLEVGLAAEQAKAALDLPLDARRVGGRLGPRRIAATACDEEEKGEEKKSGAWRLLAIGRAHE